MTIIEKTVGGIINLVSYISTRQAGNMALYLFTTPRNVSINEQQSDFLGTAFREELEYNGLPVMTYRWLGNGKTVLLAHGWESNSARWQPLIEALKKQGYNIIALDAPAHGRSGSKRFNAILYSEFIQRVSDKFNPDIIIGHSVGGMASAFYQGQIPPTQTKKLVLLGAPSEFTDVLNRYFKMMSYNNRTSTSFLNLIKEKFNAEASYFSTAKSLKNNPSQGLIIHDENDNIIPYSDALILNSNYKESKLITTQGLGHSLNDESIHKYIYEFLAS